MYFDTGPDCVNHVMIKSLVRSGQWLVVSGQKKATTTEQVETGSGPFAKNAQGEFLAKAARNSGEARWVRR